MAAVRERLATRPGATDVTTDAARGALARPRRVPGLRAPDAGGLPLARSAGALRQRLRPRARQAVERRLARLGRRVRAGARLDLARPDARQRPDRSPRAVAVGRDYADVPPTRGVFKGNAGEQLEVKVKRRGAVSGQTTTRVPDRHLPAASRARGQYGVGKARRPNVKSVTPHGSRSMCVTGTLRRLVRGSDMISESDPGHGSASSTWDGARSGSPGGRLEAHECATVGTAVSSRGSCGRVE